MAQKEDTERLYLQVEKLRGEMQTSLREMRLEFQTQIQCILGGLGQVRETLAEMREAMKHGADHFERIDEKLAETVVETKKLSLDKVNATTCDRKHKVEKEDAIRGRDSVGAWARTMVGPVLAAALALAASAAVRAIGG